MKIDRGSPEGTQVNRPKDNEISIPGIARLFGMREEELEKYCGDMIRRMNLKYRKIRGEKRDKIILEVLNQIDSKKLTISGQKRQSEWERGWEENLQEFKKSNYDVGKLVPKYFKRNVPVRMNRRYVLPEDANFVLNMTRVLCRWLFLKYLQGVEHIYEFGCGSAANLAFLAKLFPEKHFYGYDWTSTSNKIIKLLVRQYKWKIKGGIYDFFEPDQELHIYKKSAFFTFGALEQVGRNFDKYLDFVLKKTPMICINLECLYELYEPKYLLDFLAMKYHKRRDYLIGFLPALRRLERKGAVDILKFHHNTLGNVYGDTLSCVIWRVKAGGRV